MNLSPRPPFLTQGRGSVFVLLLGVVFLFAPVLFQGQVFFYGDLTLYFLPELAFQRHELLTGQLPLWNPYVLCGQPFVGNPQTWVLYPSSLLLFLFSAERMVALSTVLHVLWAALGMRSFLRQQNRTTVAATLGAIAFAFGGALVSKAQFPNMLQAMSWLPWLLWGGERLLERVSAGRLALLGLFVGLTLLAAHAQVTLMQLYVVLAWVLFRLAGLPQSERLGPLKALALAALLGLGLALAQLLPVVEHALASTRPHLSLREANRFYLPVRELGLLVAPNGFGNPALADSWRGKGNFWEPCCYIGLIPLGLIFFSRREQGRAWVFWLVVALVAFWLALGRAGGLYFLAFYALPGVKQFHDPARWLYIGTFALAVLASYGLERLRLREMLKWGLVLLAAGELIYFSRTLNPVCDPSALQSFSQPASAPTLVQGRVFHLRPYAAWIYIAPYKTYREVSLSSLGQEPTPNMLLWSQARQAGGYEPVARKDITKAIKAVGSLPEEPAALTEQQKRQLEALGVERVVGKNNAATLAHPAPRVSGGQLLSERPGELVIAPEASEVIVRETFAHGWRAWADQTSLALEPASPIFMKVQVPPGTKHVIFRYEPLSWRLGVFLSGGAGCILGALMIIALRKKVWRS